MALHQSLANLIQQKCMGSVFYIGALAAVIIPYTKGKVRLMKPVTKSDMFAKPFQYEHL